MKSTRSVVSTYLSHTTYSWKASLKASSTRKGVNRITSRAIKNEVGVVQSPNKREERKSVPYIPLIRTFSGSDSDQGHAKWHS